jgi:hypothetical protein
VFISFIYSSPDSPVQSSENLPQSGKSPDVFDLTVSFANEPFAVFPEREECPGGRFIAAGRLNATSGILSLRARRCQALFGSGTASGKLPERGAHPWVGHSS